MNKKIKIIGIGALIVLMALFFGTDLFSSKKAQAAWGVKLGSSASVAGGPGWYSGSWTYRKKISINPTKVGNDNSIGGSIGIGTYTTNPSANYMTLVGMISPKTSTVTSLQVRGYSVSTNSRFKGVITDSSGNILSNGITEIVTIPGGSSEQWWTASFATPPSVTAGTTYYIGYVFEDTNATIRYTWLSVNNAAYDSSNSFASPTSPTDASANNTNISVYANFASSDTVSNFPMLVSVTDADLKYTANGGKVASSTGGDIIFTAGNGTTALNYEIEKYASTTGELVAWVKVPFVSSTSTTPIYMYVGNASAPSVPASTAQGVWDSNYKVVMHMSDSAANTTIANSIGSNNATNQANTVGKTQTGKISKALDFNGSSDWAVTGDFTLSATSTFSAWVNSDLATNDYGSILEVEDSKTGKLGTGSTGVTNLFNFTVANNSSDLNAGVIDTSNWQYVVGTYNGLNFEGVLYLDGVVVDSAIVDNPVETNQPLYIATGQVWPGFYYPWDGRIDEIRISNTSRSTNWVKTEYNNQSSPNTFYDYGGLEKYGGRVNSSGAVAPSVKVRGGVKFR